MTETVFEGDGVALLIGGNYRLTIRTTAALVEIVRDSYMEDPILWDLVCRARAWGETEKLAQVWALRD